jgi:hypothetical protein
MQVFAFRRIYIKTVIRKHGNDTNQSLEIEKESKTKKKENHQKGEEVFDDSSKKLP